MGEADFPTAVTLSCIALDVKLLMLSDSPVASCQVERGSSALEYRNLIYNITINRTSNTSLNNFER